MLRRDLVQAVEHRVADVAPDHDGQPGREHSPRQGGGCGLAVNGKTTATALTGTVLAAGLPVVVGGNIGDTVLDRLDEVTSQHWVVLELSSFQLESVERPRLHVGVILNVTPDHLDRHRTFDRYAEIKGKIIEFAGADDFAVLNSRDETCRRLAKKTVRESCGSTSTNRCLPCPSPAGTTS